MAITRSTFGDYNLVTSTVNTVSSGIMDSDEIGVKYNPTEDVHIFWKLDGSVITEVNRIQGNVYVQLIGKRTIGGENVETIIKSQRIIEDNGSWHIKQSGVDAFDTFFVRANLAAVSLSSTVADELLATGNGATNRYTGSLQHRTGIASIDNIKIGGTAIGSFTAPYRAGSGGFVIGGNGLNAQLSRVFWGPNAGSFGFGAPGTYDIRLSSNLGNGITLQMTYTLTNPLSGDFVVQLITPNRHGYNTIYVRGT